MSDQPATEEDCARWREHSVTLNRVSWSIAKALGRIEPGQTVAMTSSVLADLDELIGRVPSMDVDPLLEHDRRVSKFTVALEDSLPSWVWREIDPDSVAKSLVDRFRL